MRGIRLCPLQASGFPTTPLPSPTRGEGRAQGPELHTCSFEDLLSLKRIKGGGKSLLRKKDFLLTIFKEKRKIFPSLCKCHCV